MQDQRYKKLRDNLDKLNFVNFLHPDSVELV